jgi:hypothetical protein
MAISLRFSGEEEKMLSKIMLDKSIKTKSKAIVFCIEFYINQYPVLMKENNNLKNEMNNLHIRYDNIINVLKSIDSAQKSITEQKELLNGLIQDSPIPKSNIYPEQEEKIL